MEPGGVERLRSPVAKFSGPGFRALARWRWLVTSIDFDVKPAQGSVHQHGGEVGIPFRFRSPIGVDNSGNKTTACFCEGTSYDLYLGTMQYMYCVDTCSGSCLYSFARTAGNIGKKDPPGFQRSGLPWRHQVARGGNASCPFSVADRRLMAKKPCRGQGGSIRRTRLHRVTQTKLFANWRFTLPGLPYTITVNRRAASLQTLESSESGRSKRDFAPPCELGPFTGYATCPLYLTSVRVASASAGRRLQTQEPWPLHQHILRPTPPTHNSQPSTRCRARSALQRAEAAHPL